MKYLYHATFANNASSIIKNGLCTGNKPNWEGMSMRDAVYLAVNPEIAIDYAETSDAYDDQEIVVFKVNPAMLDLHKIGYDWNNLCECEDDINSVAYFANIPPELLSISDDDNLQSIHDFRRMDFYEKVMSVFDDEVETNMERSE